MQKNYKFKYESSKRSQQAIMQFKYSLKEIIPDLFDSCPQPQSFQKIDIASATTPAKVAYFYTHNVMEGELLVDEESILHAFKATYLQKNNPNDTILRVNDQSFRKVSAHSEGFMGTGREAHEILEFVLEKQEWQEDSGKRYELYIIHHCHSDAASNCIKWQKFVQKYTFSESGIQYQVVASCPDESSYFGWGSNKADFKNLVKSYFKIDRLQGNMMQYHDRIKEKIKVSEDPAFNEDNNMLNSIPSEFMKGYYTLKKQFGPENQKNITRYYVAKEFNMEETRKGIEKYLKWHADLTSKYKWEDFEQFHQRQIFTYLGEDLMGHPVILNKAANVKVNEMDLEKYCIYFMYYMEVYVPTKMRGKINQINIIADLQDVGADHFKVAVTRRNIADGETYCAERQYKFFAVNVKMFAYYCWRFIKPLLPKRTVTKIFIGGNDMQEITESLMSEMPPETIPQYLGGKNPLL